LRSEVKRFSTNASRAALKLIRKNFFANQKKSEPLKALILAAGLGTRLMPLTATTPKALVKVNGVTLLEIAIRKLAAADFNEIIVNVHHHADQVISYLKMSQFGDLSITISDETEQLLDTGGAILKAKWFLDGKEPFLVHNVDVISDISLEAMLAVHKNSGGLATLSVIDRNTKRYFLFDNELKLAGWTDTSSGEIRWSFNPLPQAKKLAFSGIHIISPEIFNLFKDKGRFSIIETYLDLSKTKPIYGYIQEGMNWFDLGKPEQVEMVATYLNEHPELIESI
jgi:NDP-sugar pyrophosphorylase family protein